MNYNSQQNWFCSCFIHFRVMFGDQLFCLLFMHGMFFLIPYLVFPLNPKIPPSHPPVRHWRIRPHLLKHWRLGGPKRLSRGIPHRRLFHPFPLSVAPRSSRDFKATILRRTAIIRGLQRPNMPFFKSWHLSQLEAVISSKRLDDTCISISVEHRGRTVCRMISVHSWLPCRLCKQEATPKDHKTLAQAALPDKENPAKICAAKVLF